MAEAWRETALVALVTLLEGMTGVRFFGAAYPNDPVVERAFRAPDQVKQFPHLVVKPAAGSQFGLSAVGETALGHFVDRFRVVIFGYVSGTPEVEADTWLQRLLEDVRRTLVADQRLTLGTETIICREMEFDGTEIVDEGDLEPLASFAWDFSIIFDQGLTVG